MAYIAPAQFVARFGQEELTELLNSASAVSFPAAAADAGAIIDSYLASAPTLGATLPLSPVPARVLELAGEIVRYRLWGAKASAQVKERYDAAIAYLERVASGELAAPVGATTIAGPVYTARDRVFTDENLAGY